MWIYSVFLSLLPSLPVVLSFVCDVTVSWMRSTSWLWGNGGKTGQPARERQQTYRARGRDCDGRCGSDPGTGSATRGLRRRRLIGILDIARTKNSPTYLASRYVSILRVDSSEDVVLQLLRRNKDPIKENSGPKILKNLGVPLHFKKFWAKIFLLNFLGLRVGIVSGERKMMFTVVGCLFRRFIASKRGIQNVRLSLPPPGR